MWAAGALSFPSLTLILDPAYLRTPRGASTLTGPLAFSVGVPKGRIDGLDYPTPLKPKLGPMVANVLLSSGCANTVNLCCCG